MALTTHRDSPLPSRLRSLDALRGIAALSIVLWHWQHFGYVGTSPAGWEHTRQPLYLLFRPFYDAGWVAVDLFFMLSGFIFYWLYSSRISEGKLPLGRFALLRWSRLYPLHLLTLLVVAAVQWGHERITGSFLVFGNNDLRHFVLQLGLASFWGLEVGHSYNGPIWSVSVEVLLYALFYAQVRWSRSGPWIPGLLALLGLVVVPRFNIAIGRGVAAFFLGGCLYYGFCRIIRARSGALLRKASVGLACAGWLVTAAVLYTGTDVTHLLSQTGAGSSPLIMRVASKLITLWPVLFLFPATIVAVLSHEIHGAQPSARAAALGDLSYSSYLLHFPLQLLLLIGVTATGIDRSVFYSPLVLVSFFAVLIPLSLWSYRRFELPMQRLLRHRPDAPRRSTDNASSPAVGRPPEESASRG
jgi:peptidoglycan/LPS O-acetylase OafA/YrhL